MVDEGFHLRLIQDELSYYYLVYNGDINVYEVINLKYFSLIGNYRSIHTLEDVERDGIDLSLYIKEEVKRDTRAKWIERNKQ